MNPQQFNFLGNNTFQNFQKNLDVSTQFPGLTKDQEAEIIDKANQVNVTESQKNYIINDMYQQQLKRNQEEKFAQERERTKRELIQRSVESKDIATSKQSKQIEKKGDVADMIRKYVSATQEIDLNKLNKVPDDQIIADFTADNPDVAYAIDDFTKSQMSSQYFSEMMGFSQFEEQQDEGFFKNLLNSITYGVEKGSAGLKGLIDKGLDTIEGNTNESNISMENATAFDNYIRHKYGVSGPELAESDKGVWQQERNLVNDNPEILKQYMTTTSEDVLNFAEGYTDTLFTATNPYMALGMKTVGAAEQEMGGGVLTWLAEKMGGVGEIINEIPGLSNFRDTLSPEEQQRFDAFVGNVAVGLILGTKNKKNIIKDPKTFLMENLQPNQITKNFVQSVTGMPDKFFGATDSLAGGTKGLMSKTGKGLDNLSERGAKKITGTVSSQDKLYKAQEPRMNVLSEKKNLEKRRANSDRANELIIENGYKPTNTSERLDAHQKTLNKLWGEVMDKVNMREGEVVDQTPMIDALSNYIKEKKKLGVAGIESDIKALEAELKALKKMQKEGTTDVPLLENKKQIYNDLIDRKGQEASEVYKGGIKLLTNEIGKIEDAIISEIPGEFSALKKDVGALLDTYEDVFKADMKNQRKKGLGLTETYSRIEGIGDTLGGIVKLFGGDASGVVKGLGKLALGKALAKATDVDFLVKEGFEDLYNEKLGGNKSQASSKTAKYQVADEIKEGAYNPRASLPRPRGGWTKAKIEKQIKEPITAKQKGVVAALEAIQEFDNAEDFKAHTFYHGTQGSFVGKPSMSIPEKTFDRMADQFGGGYGQRYWAISLTTDKKIASRFGGASDHVNINPVILRKNAKVIEMPELTDSIDLEDHIERLWNEGVDAVWIGDKNAGEKELAVLNPKAIVDLGAPDSYRAYMLGSKDNPLKIKSDEDFTKIYENAPKYGEELRDLSKKYSGLKDKWAIDNYGKTMIDELLNGDMNKYREMKRAWEESPEKVEYDEAKREYDKKLYETKDNIRFQKYGVAGQGEKGISATEGLNIRNFKNGKTVKELANQYGIDTKIVDSISTPEGQRAYGMYGDRLITLSKDLKESTVPHELLHGVFDIVDSKRRTSILEGIQKKLNIDNVQAEEWLADNFSEYYRTGKFGTKGLAKGLVEKVKQFFYEVKSYIDGTYKNEKQIRQLFDDIIDGKIEGEYGVYSDPKFQSVWHGSPADFERFDSSHMGEGEGAQAHGWGHYVAVEERTGRHYAEMRKLRPNSWEYEGQKVDWTLGGRKPDWSNGDDVARNSVLSELNRKKSENKPYTPEQAIKDIRKEWETIIGQDKNTVKEIVKNGGNPVEFNNRIYKYEKRIEGLDKLDADKFKDNKVARNLYELEIPDPVKRDTPTGSNYLEEVHSIHGDEADKFAKAIRDYAKETGNTYLNDIASQLELDGEMYFISLRGKLEDILGDKGTSKFFESLGYDGIHYFGGRDGEAYVIFNDDALQITKHHKY